MKNRFIGILLASIGLLSGCADRTTYDMCVYGGTAAGVVAAYSAAQLGLNVVLVEPTNHIGGMTTGGLGWTDIGNKQAVVGVAKQFYRKVGAHYGRLEQWIFEPSVADSILAAYLNHPDITVMTTCRITEAKLCDRRIVAIGLESGKGRPNKEIAARYYLDCSYEGDLMARAGVGYTVGREANSTYGETYNGVELMNGHQFPDGVDPYRIEGEPSSGLLWGVSDAALAANGEGDSKVQSYNYRICLTDRADNMIPISRPEGYDSTRYELLLRLFEAQPEKRKLNDYFIWSRMPNGKTDINNRGGFSTDMIGMNHNYPEATYAERDSIVWAHKCYTQGLLYFYGHDERVPQELRQEMQQWGYPKDEYADNDHWTPQLYIRESRRMVGEYVATQADCQGARVPYDGIAMAAYQMDSHNCQRVVVTQNGRKMVKNEGNVEVGGGLPYPISYRSVTAKAEECTNLLVPVCLSASHIAYGSIRMEPVFMVLGQASAIAVHEAIKNDCCDLQDVDSRRINIVMSENPFMDGSQPDILIDDSDVSVDVDGLWKRQEHPVGYGHTYLELKPTKELQRVRFSTEIPSSGHYTVYSYQHARRHLSSATSFVVSDGQKRYSRLLCRDEINVEGQTSGAWTEVGTYYFDAHALATVEINNYSADGPLRADAVMFVKSEKRSKNE